MKKMFAVLAALSIFALPGCYFKYKKSAQQSEAIMFTASIATAQISFESENKKWGSTFEDIGWTPFGETRYSFYLNSCEEVIPSTMSGYKACPEELKKAFAECHEKNKTVVKEYLKKWNEAETPDSLKGFCAAAVANLDGDPKMDIWMVDPSKNPTNVSDDKVK